MSVGRFRVHFGVKVIPISIFNKKNIPFKEKDVSIFCSINITVTSQFSLESNSLYLLHVVLYTPKIIAF